MRTFARDLTWVCLYALAMPTAIAMPVAGFFVMAEWNYGLHPDMLFLLIPIVFVFFASLGVLGVLHHRRRLTERGIPTPVERDEETQLMQELHQRSLRMERRLESLETILLGRVEQREHSEY